MSETNTIFARATAVGRAGVSIIRISGRDALSVCEVFGRLAPCPARQAILHNFQYNGEFIDSGLIIVFKGPHSFTGEDVVEFQLHGGVAIINRVIEILSSLSYFRMAKPGEFSQRAFLNEKMDLVEAEGLVDLINAETKSQQQQASRLMQGHASKFFIELRQRILEAMALLEAYIDFPDEEIPLEVSQQVKATIEALRGDIEYQLGAGQSAERLREGFNIILLGSPNSGKSTLLNALVKREAAIVSDIAGTTRDIIEVNSEVHGIPVTFIDTAGLRESNDIIEKQGIERALEKAEQADIILQLVDSKEMPVSIENDAIIVATKSDGINAPDFNYDYLISAKRGDGVEEMLDGIASYLEVRVPKEDCFALHQRHCQLLAQANENLRNFQEGGVVEIQAEHLRLAASSLSDIIGHHTVDDLLDIVFSSFCIGK